MKVRVTEEMVRRFCEANAIAGHGSPCDCDGEYHKGIRAGLRAVLSGVGELCSPRFCECKKPEPDPTYHNRCKAVVRPARDPMDGRFCYGFIRGVSERRDGRKK